MKCKCIPARKKKNWDNSWEKFCIILHTEEGMKVPIVWYYICTFTTERIYLSILLNSHLGITLLYLNFTLYYYYTRSHYLFSIKSPHDQVITEKINYSIHICLTHIFWSKKNNNYLLSLTSNLSFESKFWGVFTKGLFMFAFKVGWWKDTIQDYAKFKCGKTKKQVCNECLT